jgi:hypothetical protein
VPDAGAPNWYANPVKPASQGLKCCQHHKMPAHMFFCAGQAHIFFVQDKIARHVRARQKGYNPASPFGIVLAGF